MGKKAAIYNPESKPVETLPVIYGFNNGGNSMGWSGELVAEDGTPLGGHFCSNETFMLGDLGILEGARPDRHDDFRAHYPQGYRMEFVSYEQFDSNAGLKEAIRKMSEKSQGDRTEQAP